MVGANGSTMNHLCMNKNFEINKQAKPNGTVASGCSFMVPWLVHSVCLRCIFSRSIAILLSLPLFILFIGLYNIVYTNHGVNNKQFKQ